MVRLVLMCAGIVGVALLGGSVVLLSRLAEARLRRFIALGAGAMLGAAFLHMLPEAAEKAGPFLGSTALAGFLALFFLEKFVLAHPCEEQACDFHGMGLAAFIGMSFHNLIEGMSLGTGMLQGRDLGFAVFLAILVHKMPNAMSLAGLLLAGGYRRPRIFGLLLLFALMVPLGALASFAALGGLREERVVGIAVAAAAGTFLHVAASDLLPEVHRATEGRLGNLAAFVLGLALMGGARYLH